MEFTRHVCDLRECIASTGVCSDGDRRCCCRTFQESTIDLTDFGCTAPDVRGVTEESLRTADSCICATCDDIVVTVRLTVVSSANNDPIPAAQIFETTSNNMLGLTLNDGTFRFNEPLETRALSLLVQASLFVDKMIDVQLMTSPSPLEVRVVLTPRSLVALGLGGSSVILRLGDTLAISAPPQSFSTMDGETYLDLVMFSGMFMSAEEDIDLPNGTGRFFTNDNQTFRVMEVFLLDFRDTEGDELNATNLRITLSSDVGVTLFLVAFVDGEWVITGTFTQIDAKRKKRQPVILSTTNVPVGVFAGVAANFDINCFLQARTFGFVNDTVMVPRPGVIVELNQRSRIINNEFLYTFGTNTGGQEPELVNHAVCLPVACGMFDTATLEATSISGGQRLLPIDFDMSLFGMEENFPFAVGFIFSFLEVKTATDIGSNRPFYNSSQTCIEAASIPQENANPLDYFGFFTPEVPPLPPIGNCFIKIQILDCYESNRVNVISFDIGSGVISQNTQFDVNAIDEDILDLYDAGKTSGDFPAPDPATLTFCDSSCATPRIACAPFVCGEAVQVIVRPAVRRGLNPCALTSFSLILMSDIFTGSSDLTTNVLLVDPTEFLADDFNDENLGLYFHPNSAELAFWQCAHGPNNNTQPVTGHAATFSCFDV